MGTQQFERGVGNQFLEDNVQVDIERNTSNQFDDDKSGRDIENNKIQTGEQNISGASEIAGQITVNDGGDANLSVRWTDGSDNIVGREEPDALQGITSSDDGTFNIIVKSTNVKIVVDGTSNDVDYTVNAH